jgi:hypothetical protein
MLARSVSPNRRPATAANPNACSTRSVPTSEPSSTARAIFHRTRCAPTAATSISHRSAPSPSATTRLRRRCGPAVSGVGDLCRPDAADSAHRQCAAFPEWTADAGQSQPALCSEHGPNRDSAVPPGTATGKRLRCQITKPEPAHAPGPRGRAALLRPPRRRLPQPSGNRSGPLIWNLAFLIIS